MTDIVKAHSATSAQVLLRWALQMGFQIIPKSVKKSLGRKELATARCFVRASDFRIFPSFLDWLVRHRIAENLKVFDLELSVAELDALNNMEGNLNQYWQPLGAPVDAPWQMRPLHLRCSNLGIYIGALNLKFQGLKLFYAVHFDPV